MINRLHVAPDRRITRPRRIYHARAHNVPEGRLMQLPRRYDTTDSQTYSTSSLVRLDGRWHLCLPYYCYSGSVRRFRPLSNRLHRTICRIDRLGCCHARYRLVVKALRGHTSKWVSAIQQPISRHLTAKGREQKRFEKMWSDMGKEL